MPYYTPLRYPGGKRRLSTAVSQLLAANRLHDVEYVEPYAGGAAVALALLFEERASRVHINDLNPAVYAFWHSVLNENDALCNLIDGAKLSLAEWGRQRRVLSASPRDNLLQLGFAAFYLNRTNRSGILTGGVIGGQKQESQWGIDARFNRDELVQRIKRVGRYRNRIQLGNEDALGFVRRILPTIGQRAFVFFDPPYIDNGEDLYLNQYTLADHKDLARRISQLKTPWMVTYDTAAAREGLFAKHRRITYGLPYSAQKRYQGEEVMFLSQGLRIPSEWQQDGAILLTRPGSKHPLMGRLETVGTVPACGAPTS